MASATDIIFNIFSKFEVQKHLPEFDAVVDQLATLLAKRYQANYPNPDIAKAALRWDGISFRFKNKELIDQLEQSIILPAIPEQVILELKRKAVFSAAMREAYRKAFYMLPIAAFIAVCVAVFGASKPEDRTA